MKDAGFTDIHIYSYNPISWLPLSAIQYRRRKENTLKFSYPAYLNLVCYPIGWLAGKLGMAEELV
ncbi:unnamed protein product, partial [marine sediment metagenome]